MKSKNVQQSLVSFAVGFIFAIGLAISGMTQPQKIIGFLDPFNWEPTLIFVMIGAIVIHAISYPLIKRRSSPVLDLKWHVPTRKDLTFRLILGSALFGIGWGLGGYCPGPGLTSITTFDSRALAFVFAMIVGMLVFKKSEKFLGLRE